MQVHASACHGLRSVQEFVNGQAPALKAAARIMHPTPTVFEYGIPARRTLFFSQNEAGKGEENNQYHAARSLYQHRPGSINKGQKEPNAHSYEVRC